MVSRLWLLLLFLTGVTAWQPVQQPRASLTRLYAESSPPKNKKKPILPTVGDLVRWSDVDGGRPIYGVGKISFIQTVLGSQPSWSVEVTPLEDVGDGYFAEYGQRKRKKILRNLAEVSPVVASWVRSEAAYRVPRTVEGTIQVRAEQYDLEAYEGPVYKVDTDVVQQDGVNYAALKGKLLQYAALTGLGGTAIADLVKGTEDAIIYFAGVAASLLYLFLLSVKTDTLASENAKLGDNVSNLRFVTPLLVFVGVALYNQSLGDQNPVPDVGMFTRVTPEQFAAGTIGFLTYRVPLFLTQIQDAFKEDDEVTLPGSAGVVQKLSKQSKTESTATATDSLTTILLVSGPQATGRKELVEKLIQGDERFVAPTLLDRIRDGATFERLQQRDELLSIDADERMALTKDGIFGAAKSADLVVIDADVALSKRLTTIPGLRIVGVWVGLNSVKEFEARISDAIDRGEIPVEEDDARENVVRAKIKEVVKEIEYGISSGIFEFTIFNEDPEASLKQLREAASYCFK